MIKTPTKQKEFIWVKPELVWVISRENSFQEDSFLESTRLTFNNSIIQKPEMRDFSIVLLDMMAGRNEVNSFQED
jgi:hypothetical protein